MNDNAKIYCFIHKCNEPERLRDIIRNARGQGEDKVAETAFRRLISLVPSEQIGSIEHDFWQSINAFEFILSEERGKTTRLTRTRQKVGRVGVVETLKDWALNNTKTAGFEMLLKRKMPELTGEAIVLRHPENFVANVRIAAKNRLIAEGVDLISLAVANAR